MTAANSSSSEAANDKPGVATSTAGSASRTALLSDSPAPQFSLAERRGGLRRADLDPACPLAQFQAWYADAAAAAAVAHPETCTLSTASLPSGRVSARMVYLKELDATAGAFVLYTNLGTSHKAADLATNAHAALTFWWEPLERQVRVEGRAERLSPSESQAYFDTRVRGSRIGAWASRQSEPLLPLAGDADDDGRAALHRRVADADARFAGAQHIPVPTFWGGLRIVPDRVEFWQGRESRLHDRFVYERASQDDADDKKNATWTIQRLSP